ncbi:helix-turn-helix transcriptional regulator [Bacillus sp. SM2101]|uniref:helix-turn-helix domain-containing protein n=1 Tax=Bacillus sp. SM2101 TaxID=2805366 RepID=UPI001BDE7150|nr:helix-turn-helix transcriptional regulator [Bacillus sp. SM2101]
MQRYVLDFDGNIGDFIKIMRKSKKINSIELSKKVGKSDAYISHIENGRNKNPDYSTLYNIFKIIGTEEKKIEDYLEHFGILSPERLAHEEAMMIARMNPTEEDLKHMEKEVEYHNQLQEEYGIQMETAGTNDDSSSSDSSDLVYDVIDKNLKTINDVLRNMQEDDISNAFELIDGLSKTFNEMRTKLPLYRFMIKFFSENISSLDNKGLTRVLNILYEEENRVHNENMAFGKPRRKKVINEL